MKRFVKYSILAVIFAFSFLLCGLTSVKAAGVEAALDNTTISGADVTYTVGGVNYYAVKGKAQDKSLVLRSKTNGQWTQNKVLWVIPTGNSFKVYNAQVAIVKCSNYDAANSVCKTWSTYTYNTDSNVTMDALKQTGLTLNFKAESLVAAKGVTEVNGANLGKLTSTHGIDKTYFVIVQYRLQTGTLYEPDVFRVVFEDELSKLDITQTTQNSAINVRATAGLPIVNLKYFSTTTKLADNFDFATEYATAGNGVEAKVDLTKAPEAVNGEYVSEVSLTSTPGTYYYVQATDALGNVKLLDVTANIQKDNTPNAGGQNPDVDGNVGNTNVGKIILIALLVVLVISLVLVIVQRIVDYRRRVY